MVQKEGRLQAIICAGSVACSDFSRAQIGQLNHPDAPRAPVAVMPRVILPVSS
jgi:hypothetical protein